MTETATEITTDKLFVPEISTKSGNLTINSAANIIFEPGKTISFTGTTVQGLSAADAIDIEGADDATLNIHCDTDNAGGNVSQIVFLDGPVAGPTETGRIVANDDANTLTMRAGTGNTMVLQANGTNTVTTLDATGTNNMLMSGNIALNTTNHLRFRNDEFHVARYGSNGFVGSAFAGQNKDGPIIHGFAGGFLGVKTPGGELISADWGLNATSFYANDGLTFALQCDTANVGGQQCTLAFRDGTYAAPTTTASIIAAQDAGQIVFRTEAGMTYTLQTGGANDRIMVQADGTGTWEAVTSLTLSSTADANSGSILLDNTGVALRNGANERLTIAADGTGVFMSPTSLTLSSTADANSGSILLDNAGIALRNGVNNRLTISTAGVGAWNSPDSVSIESDASATAGKLTVSADGVILNNNLTFPMYGTGTLFGASSFGTANVGQTRIIWGLIDGNQATGVAASIVRQSGGISSYAKTGVGLYTIEIDANIFNNVAYVAVATPQTTGLIANLLILSNTSITVDIVNLGGVATDSLFHLYLIGNAALTAA